MIPGHLLCSHTLQHLVEHDSGDVNPDGLFFAVVVHYRFFLDVVHD